MATTKKTSTSTIIGINTSKISAMKAEIDAYKTYVKKQTDISATKAEIRKAIKGSNSEATLIKLSNQLESTLESYLSNLDQFKTQLDTLASTYKKSDSSNSTYADVTKQLQSGS